MAHTNIISHEINLNVLYAMKTFSFNYLFWGGMCYLFAMQELNFIKKYF